MPETVAVIGAGMMGRGIAACCASGGNNVILFDSNVNSLPAAVKAADDLTTFLLSNGVPKSSPGRGKIRAASSLQEAVSNVLIVFEAIIEDTQIKQKVFLEIEKYCQPNTVLCSNTSSLSVSEITEPLKTRQRCMTAHFIGPAHLVPLVELCPTKYTDMKVVPIVQNFLLACGKSPAVMKKEIDGFIAARLQAALYREAMNICLAGAADPETIDKAVMDGFGRRLNQIGPFHQADFAGVDLVLKTHGRFFPQLGAQQSDQLAEKLVAEGRKGVKSGKGHYDWPESQIKEV
eukprot:gene500-627_t